jgi:hypothetical protein
MQRALNIIGSTEVPSDTVLTLLKKRYQPTDFVPLHLETRTHVSTAVMCRHLNRKPQTARVWACYEKYPTGLRPIRIMGRLSWPVASIIILLEQQSVVSQAG